MLPAHPGRVVLEIDSAGALTAQLTYEPPVDEHAQRYARGETRHQKMLSISVLLFRPRVPTVISRFSAVRTSNSVPNSVPGSPFSRLEMVACRRLIAEPSS